MTVQERITEQAVRVLGNILTPLGYEFEVTATMSDDGLTLMLTSPDARYIIGEDGDRLDDLQYLVNRIVQVDWEDAPRVRVDCDSYRERAENKLLRRARAKAERVLETGKPLMMERLNAYQRRLVHNELAKIPGISTESEDTESRFKRITISYSGE